MQLDFDIAIVGGGIAGLAAAKEISKKCDANVVVIEEHKEIGRPSTSSAFTFADFVEKHNLQAAVERYYSRVGMYSFLGRKVIFHLRGPKLVVLDYARACKELLLQSRKEKIEIFSETKAVGLQRAGKELLIKLSGNNSWIKCGLLIDASGTSFISANFFSFRIPRFYSHPYGYRLINCEISDDYMDELAFFIGRSIGSGGGWFYPITNNECKFGIAEISRTPFFPFERLQQFYEFAKCKMQPFCQMIENSSPIEREAGSIPAEPQKNLVKDNVMRVGDAAGQATPHMLEGIRPSVEFATLCGRVAVKAYEKQDFSENSLKVYEKLWSMENKLLYLYLLSMEETFFSRGNVQADRAISPDNSVNINGEAYLRHLRGEFEFPSTLLFRLSRICSDPDNLKIAARFFYHNIRWLLE